MISDRGPRHNDAFSGSKTTVTQGVSVPPGAGSSLTPAKRLLFLTVLALLAVPIALLAEISYRLRHSIPLWPSGPAAATTPASSGAAGVGVMDFDDVHYYEIFQPIDDPDLLYLPKPGFSRGAVTINAHGFRDREYALEKPPGTFRIVVLGDSIVWGHGLPLADTFPKQLERLLDPDASGRFEVLNFGVSGYSARQEVGIFRARAAAFHPDLVIVGFCLNDSYYSSEEGDFLRDGAGDLFHRSFLWEHAQLSLIEILRQHDPQLALRFRQTVDVHRHLADLASMMGGKTNLIVIFPVFESFSHYHDGKSHKTLSDAAVGLPFVVHDLFADYQGRPAEEYRVDPADVIHPNRLGNEVAARATLAALRDAKLVPEP